MELASIHVIVDNCLYYMEIEIKQNINVNIGAFTMENTCFQAYKMHFCISIFKKH